MRYEGQTETPIPVHYNSWISGPDGAHFVIYKEPNHTKEDLQRAKGWLRNNRDVLSIQIKPYNPDKND